MVWHVASSIRAARSNGSYTGSRWLDTYVPTGLYHQRTQSVCIRGGRRNIPAGNKQANALANETVLHTHTKHTNQTAVTRTAEEFLSDVGPKGKLLTQKM